MPALSLIEAFRSQVRLRGDDLALMAETRDGSMLSLTWRALGNLVDATAEHLANRFEQSGSPPRRIGHSSDNSLCDVLIALASMALAAVEFPFDHRLAQSEVQRRWDQIGGLWIDDSDRELLASWARQGPAGSTWRDFAIDLDAPSLVLWTSGTTGTPRGVTLSQRNLCGNAQAKLGAVPQSVDDARLCVLPLCHAYARTCDFGTWLLSGCVLGVTFGYAGLQHLAKRVCPTLINAVPAVTYRMLDAEELQGLDRLRLLGCGGAAMSPTAFEAWKQRGVTVIQGYGLTEASPVICSATPEDARAGFVGRFVDGWQADIRDQQLWVRGPHVMLGYWQDPVATALKIDADGWLATGDLVEQDPATGQVRILGRADEVIVLDSAHKVHPGSIERAVEQVPGVRHAVLLRRQHLELWIDPGENAGKLNAGERSSSEPEAKHWIQTQQLIREILDRTLGAKGCTIHRFPTPLRESDGELTHKGTIRRNRIVETRFADQAGS